MSKIAIIGSQNAILAFRALGFKDLPIKSVEEGVLAIKKIQQENDYAIVFLTEDWAEKLDKELDILRNVVLPVFTVIPSPALSLNYGKKELSKIVEKAVGSDILKIKN